jgi:ABC-type Mn2+/Zn2+ transport system ATPase subunit
MSNAATSPAPAKREWVRLEGLAIGHGGKALLSGIDLVVRGGDTLAVVGPNGSGKTTLLSTVLGVIPPVAGRIVKDPGLVVGYVPQRGRHDGLFPLPALEVVASGGMGVHGRFSSRFAPEAEARAALGALGVENLARRLFRDLSGGQQQRVLLARALVRQPNLLVLDEPTVGMDLPSEQDLMATVAALTADRETAVILVTHHLALAAMHCGRIAILDRVGGQFAADETAQLFTPERLSGLYGRPVEIVDSPAGPVVRLRPGEGRAP